MAYEMREGSGSLFVNDYKEKPSQPDYKGEALLDGKVIKIVAWEKSTVGGKAFFGLSLEYKGESILASLDSKPYVATASNGVPEGDVPF